MSIGENEKIDIGIITALSLERDSVLKYFNLRRITTESNEVFFKGTIKHKPTNRNFNIILNYGDVGNVESSLATIKLINEWNPKYIILLGIAGGINQNGVDIGDIVIPKEIIYYTLSKEEKDATEIRPSGHQTDPQLYDHMKNFPSMEDDKSWIQNIILPEHQEELLKLLNLKSRNDISPKVHCGPIFSGDKVVKSSKTINELLKYSPKSLGIEMESWGSIMASFKEKLRPRFIVIRGISDLADKPSKKKWDKIHSYAANVASAYLKSFLEVGSLSPEKDIETEIKRKPRYYDYTEEEKIKIENEDVKSNYFEIIKPELIWLAKTKIRDYKEINNQLDYSPPYILYEDKLISFFSFEKGSPFERFIDINTIEPIKVKEWCEDDKLVKKIVQLFNQVIFVLCKLRRLYHNNEKTRWYLPNWENKETVKKSWKRIRKSKKTVIRNYKSLNTYLHHSFTLRAIYLNNKLCYFLQPRKIFTVDGFNLEDSDRTKSLEEKFRKSPMSYNPNQLRLIEFWYYYLFKDDEIFSDPVVPNTTIKRKRKETRKILSQLEISEFKAFKIPRKPIEKPPKKTKKRPIDKKSKQIM